MVMRALAIVALVVSAWTGAALAADTLKPGDAISGKLRFLQIQHPNGTWMNVYQLVVDRPKKLAGEDEFCDPDKPPRTFHLVVMDDKAKLARLKHLLGKHVAVVGDEYICSETAWHVGDVVVFSWHFAQPDKR
jgi:hypothetical protein